MSEPTPPHSDPVDPIDPATTGAPSGAVAPSASPQTSPPAPRQRGSHRRLWLGLSWAFSGLALAALLIFGPLWALGSPQGSAWLLSQFGHLGVETLGPQGALLGNFEAQRITVKLPRQGRVVIEHPRWWGLTISPTSAPSTWARLHARAVSADSVTVVAPAPGPATGKAPTLPRQVQLPVEIVVDDARVGALHLPGLPNHPVRDLHGVVHLSGPTAPHHRVENFSARAEPMLITGHARIGGVGPMALDVTLLALHAPPAASAPAAHEAASPNTPIEANTSWLPAWARALRQDWRAELRASGPLARFKTEARVRAQGQQLDASAWVEPVSPWPLPELHASTQGLDLSALFAWAPATAINGEAHITPHTGPSAAPAPNPRNSKAAPPNTWALRTQLTNARPGLWPERLLPLRSLQGELQLMATTPLSWQLQSLDAQLADGRQALGGIKLKGHGDLRSFDLSAELSTLRLSAINPQLPAMTFSGPVLLAMNPAPVPVPAPLGAAKSPAANNPPTAERTHADLPQFRARADLSGRMTDLDRAVQLRLNASGTTQRIELHELQALAGGAQATLSGRAERAANAWQLQARAGLVEFDPRPWLPAGPQGAWPAGAYRINLNGNLALTLPDAATGLSSPRAASASTAQKTRRAIDRLAAVRGEAQLTLSPSMFAGLPLTGQLKLRHPLASEPLSAQIQLDAGDNRLQLDGQLTPDTVGRDDQLTLRTRAPNLAQLRPLLRFIPAALAAGMTENMGGALEAEAHLKGRWPDITTQGQASVPNLRAGPLHMSQGKVNWQLGSQAQAPFNVLLEVATLGWGPQHLAQTRVQLQGNTNAHTLSLRSEVKAAPPSWVARLEGRPPAPMGSPPPPTLVNASARGSLSGGPFDGSRDSRAPLNWAGTLQLLELRTEQAGATPWVSTRNVGLEMHGGEQPHFVMAAGRAELLTAGLHWNRIEWHPAQGSQHPQRLDLVAELEPLAVAPLLRRVQPEFGWGGDLRIGGKVNIQQANTFSADIVLERLSGDLHVTDDSGTQALGLTDLVLALNAQDGVWGFTQGMAGSQLGVAAGSFVVRTSPQRAWPEAQAPLQGVFEAKVENLGTWGAWVPTGWRLGGQLRTTASVGGRFGAPEYTGHVQGQNISVRNLLEGVNLNQGAVDITLQGDTARINQFSAKAGKGSVQLTGTARLGAAPQAQLQLSADKFQLIARVDRRLVLSGQAQLQLDQDSLALDGRFDADEGLFDLTRLAVPSLGNDVTVTGRVANETTTAPSTPAKHRDTRIKLQLGLGERLTLRGKGLDTGLRGDIKVASSGDKQSWTGSVRTDEGSYTAYGQKLSIDRGVITFTGSLTDPRLDITATRPNLDVRVGWIVTGTLLNPRVKLFSEPEMSDIDKLSWLMLGRASDGLGKSDTALLQRAALGMLAGDDPSVSDQVLKTIGLDEISVRQTEGDTKDTVVSIGKQLSRRWYVGYERGLNATEGSWQLIYRVAQRFTLRAQSGTDQSLDMIWSWRWE